MPVRLSGLAALALVLAGCGSKTGLLSPEPSVRMDAGELPRADAGTDAPSDAGVDAGLVACPDVPVALVRREVDTVLLIDGSGSMSLTWDGRLGGVGLPTRWRIVRDTLADVLPPYDDRLRLGAKIFPTGAECEVAAGLDVRPHRGAVGEIIALFDRWAPEGFTPAAVALERTLAELDDASDDPRVVVMAMDGGPNCNDDPGEPPETCTCTSGRRSCLRPPPEGPRACLDRARMLEDVRVAYEERGVPIVVVGIDDPTRPDLSDFLDELAVAGGWARPATEGRRFYIAREPEDLRTAFGQIADTLARCVLSVPVPPPEGARVTVHLEGSLVRRDPAHVEGWDWTDEARGAMAFFGSACDALRFGDPEITAEIVCE